MLRLSDSKVNLEFPSGQPLVSSPVFFYPNGQWMRGHILSSRVVFTSRTNMVQNRMTSFNEGKQHKVVCNGVHSDLTKIINICIWVRSRNCGCLVTWFCYQLIAKPGNKTATFSWPDPYIVEPLCRDWKNLSKTKFCLNDVLVWSLSLGYLHEGWETTSHLSNSLWPSEAISYGDIAVSQHWLC